MDIRPQVLGASGLKEVYNKELRKAFPCSELVPLSVLELQREHGVYDVIEFDCETEKLGYALLWWHSSRKFAVLDYFCVPQGKRNAGIGGKLLDALRKSYPDIVFICELDAPTGDFDRDTISRRRIGFYKRNGSVDLSYECSFKGVRYKCIYFAACSHSESDILQKHREIYSESFVLSSCFKAVRLPFRQLHYCLPLSYRHDICPIAE